MKEPVVSLASRRAGKGCPLVVVKGAGDLGSGVVWRLRKCGFPVVALERERPTVIRRAVAFASAVFEGKVEVEGITAQKAALEDVSRLLEAGITAHRVKIPIFLDLLYIYVAFFFVGEQFFKVGQGLFFCADFCRGGSQVEESKQIGSFVVFCR